MVTAQEFLSLNQDDLVIGGNYQLPVSSLLCLSKSSNLSIEDILCATDIKASVLIERTGLLSRNSSRKLMALAEIIAHASNVFGTIEKAIWWLVEPIPALNGNSPLSRVGVSDGKEQVSGLLRRIEHGEFS